MSPDPALPLSEETLIVQGRTEALYAKSYSSVISSVLISFTFAYFYLEQFSFQFLASWLIVLTGLNAVRFWITFDFNQHKDRQPDYRKYENRLILLTAIIGCAWAFFIVNTFLLPGFEYRTYGLLLLVGMVATAVPIYSANMTAVYAFTLPSIFSSLPVFFFLGGQNIAIAIALFGYVLLMYKAAKDSHQTLISTLKLRYRTQVMAANLEEARQKQQLSEQRSLLHRKLSPTGVIEWNTNFECIDWNPAAERIFGFSKEEVMGHHITERILSKSVRPAIDKVWQELLTNSGGYYSLNENTTKDGRAIMCEWHNTPLINEQGVIIGVTSLVEDVTERINTEEELRLSRQRLLLHREQSPVGVIEWNTGFEFLDWNPAAEKIFGFTKDEVVGRHITERILPESAKPAVDKVWEELLADTGGYYSLNENTTKDGRTILCEWHNTPLVDHNGEVIGVTSLVDDVTEREQKEEQLRQTQKMDAIGKLTGGIAHDFNNMLGVILGFAELMRAKIGDDSSAIYKYNNQILQAGDRAKKLTSKLLKFSREAPAYNEVISMNSMLNGMRQLLETTLTPRIELKYELDENLWPVFLDQSGLEDCVLNMAINSMHAMPGGGMLELKTHNSHLSAIDSQGLNVVEGDYVLLTVTDTGEGMSTEVKQKMFDPFFSTKDAGGTGLGLSQVYGYVQQLEGDIKVQSEPGHGTRITLYIPRSQESELVAQEQSFDDQEKTSAGHETVLVVDDEVSLLDLSEEILKSEGYKVLRAENAEQALEILSREPVDVLLSDVVMPGMDGYELAMQVQSLYPSIKIQMISGFSDEHQKKLADNKLHTDRLSKPYSSAELLMKIRTLLAQS